MIELTQDRASGFRLGFAGDAYNTAAYLSRCLGDAQVALVSATGDDELSDELMLSVQEQGVVPELVRVANATPGLYIVRVDDSGERTFTYHRTESPAKLIFDDSWPLKIDRLIVESELVYFSAITLQIMSDTGRSRFRSVIERARAAGATIAFDSNCRSSGWPDAAIAIETIGSFLPFVDICLPTFEDEQSMRGFETPLEVVNYYTAAGVQDVVVKNGVGPTLLSAGSAETILVGLRNLVSATDTTGAGDAFNAGYLAGRLEGLDPLPSVKCAQDLSAIVVQHPGAIIPTNKKVAHQ